MEPITSDTILIMAGSFLCVFLSLVTAGGLFLYLRTKQQRNSSAPQPQPPPVTRDVHADPLSEMPTRHDEADEPFRPPTPRSPPPAPVTPPPALEPPEITVADETVTRSRPTLIPLGVEPESDFDEGGETTTRNIPVGGGFDPIVLPSPKDNDTTPTVIIDRNKPMLDDDDDDDDKA